MNARLLPILITLLVLFQGCDLADVSGNRKRPVGYLKLGKAADFRDSQQYLPEAWLVLMHDENGFYAMSSLCTYDLTPLSQASSESGIIWESKYSTSRYDQQGKVISGPAKHALPYYRLRFDSGVYNGPKDTLYALIGDEVEPGWRLQIPEAASTAAAVPVETVQVGP